MPIEGSSTQAKRVAKINRLRSYFKTDMPTIYEWSTTDENLDFSSMTDEDVEKYLAGKP